MPPNAKHGQALQYGRASNYVDAIIIGTGISGICSAIDIIRQGNGRNFLMFEKSSQVGGTWNDNIYPGCCCDVWGHLYSFSFEPNANWTREYPSQEELHKYLIGVANKWRLYENIRFSCPVEEARWDESSKKWTVRVRRPARLDCHEPQTQTFTADFVISAVGQLSLPSYPDIPGIDQFHGKIMHSARWDWDYNLEGKRVAVVGTGSTSAQIVPAIAPHVKSLAVYQRSPTWVMPRHDAPISKSRRLGYQFIPGMLQARRRELMDLRESHFKAGFDVDSDAHAHVMDVSRNHLQTQLSGSWNAELRCKLTPKYPFSCKRIVVSDDLYPALARENVRLETSRISRITPSGIEMQSGECCDVDAIILATGFQTTKFLHPIKIYGRNGHSLEAAWAQGAAAYLGITVNDFPNLGMLYGPNTNLAYNSLILPIESQSQYISRLVSAVLSAKRKGQTLAIEPRPDVVARYNDWIQDRLATSTFADPRCSSWFKTADGKITNNWCGSAIEYQERTSYIDWSDFDLAGSAADLWRDMTVTRWKRVVEESQPWNSLYLRYCGLLVSVVLALALYFHFGGHMPIKLS